MRTKLICCFAIWLAPSLLRAVGPFDKLIDSPMYQMPKLPVPPVQIIFPKGAKELWLRALERPESDMRCRAAHAIAQAHRDGVKGFETTIDPLLTALDQSNQHPAVRLAVAEALIALEARRAAGRLFDLSQSGGSDLRELIEPALARWDYRPMRAVWLQRLRETATVQRNLLLAIRGLAVVREEQAAERLREMVLAERTPGPIRLESARALAALRSSGLERDAERLAADASPRGLVARLAAASMLRRHHSADAIRLLQRLTRDPEPAVAGVAAERLLALDPQLLVSAVDHLLANPDANLRLLALEVLRRRPTDEHLRLLTARLDDIHSGVRIQARGHLLALAGDKARRERILSGAMALLKTRNWRSLEQATLLLTQLDHKPAAGRLVQLLTFDRPEVVLTAAWSLRRLAVPQTLPGVLAHVEREVKRLLKLKAADRQLAFALHFDDHVLSQLNQFLGQQRHRPADAVLRQFIPKRPNAGLGFECRAAAIWALSLIHEGGKEDALVAQVEERLNDVNSIPPEDGRVRRMSAVFLARLKVKKSLPNLRKYFRDKEASGDLINNVCGWAVEQITGEVMRPPKTIRAARRNWFLAPAE